MKMQRHVKTLGSLTRKQSMSMSPRSEKLQDEIELQYQKATKEAAELAAEEVAMESTSEEEEEEGSFSLKKRKRQLEKEAELHVATEEVRAVFANKEKPDKVAHLAKQLAHWKRMARKATKEVRRIKSECSCGRAVNYPWIFRK
jgi:hypothetical protein